MLGLPKSQQKRTRRINQHRNTCQSCEQKLQKLVVKKHEQPEKELKITALKMSKKLKGGHRPVVKAVFKKKKKKSREDKFGIPERLDFKTHYK